MASFPRWVAFAKWFRGRASLCLVFALGIAVGVGCRYPTGWALPDNTAAMVAAVIGAFATAAAVVIGVAAQRESDNDKQVIRQNDLRERAKLMLIPLFSQAKRACQEDLGYGRQYFRAVQLAEDAKRAHERIRDSRLLTEELDNDGLLALTFVEMRLSIVVSDSNDLVKSLDVLDTADAATETEVADSRAKLKTNCNKLMDEVSDMTGQGLETWKI